MSAPPIPLKYSYEVSDERCGDGSDLELLSVSSYRGVVPRSSITDKEARADDLSAYKVVRRGQVVINRMSAYQGALGIAYQDGIVSPEYIVLRPIRVEPRFLTFMMKSSWFVSEMTKRLRGIGSAEGGASVRTPRINPEDLGGIECRLPALDQQRAIADYLDAETARIDALVAKKQQLIHLLEERVRSLADEHFLPRLGEGLTRLGRLAEIRSGVTLNAAREPQPGDQTLPYLRVANVQPGRLDLDEVKVVTVPHEIAMRCALEPGDVLMTEGGDIDKLGRGTIWSGEIDRCLHQNHVFAVRPGAKLNSEFLALLTRTSHARGYFESTGVQSTNLASTNSTKVSDFAIPVLTLTEQIARVQRFHASDKPLQVVVSTSKRQIHLLAERRQALITAAVTGEFQLPWAAR